MPQRGDAIRAFVSGSSSDFVVGPTLLELPNARQLDTSAISEAEQRAVDAMFAASRGSKSSRVRDGFRYRIQRSTSDGTETIEVPEESVLPLLARCVKDELVQG